MKKDNAFVKTTQLNSFLKIINAKQDIIERKSKYFLYLKKLNTEL